MDIAYVQQAAEEHAKSMYEPNTVEFDSAILDFIAGVKWFHRINLEIEYSQNRK